MMTSNCMSSPKQLGIRAFDVVGVDERVGVGLESAATVKAV